MRVLIIDDDCFVTQALATILENKGIDVVASGNSGEEAIVLYQQYKPDVLLMDIRMEHMNGVDASEHILQQHPQAKILFLTTFSDDEYIVKALHLGVKGYILKQNYDSIAPALEAVWAGQNVFNTEIITKIPSLMKKNDTKWNTFDLTEREIAFISLVAKGLNNKEIAKTLFLSEGTVRNYLSAILEKLDLRDRTQLAIFYYQHQ